MLRIVVGVSRFPNLLILPFFESTQNQSPFPPPAFTGFFGTMGSSDSRRGTDHSVRLEVDFLHPDGSLMFRIIPSLRAVAITPVR